ncbi:nucleoside-diphosphate kinase [Candidatus Roizmanbacteria bacterium CG_4_10_14_0_8_um_filter_39_9]|uniref:Nucleoside diphosphate kinase n=1 Tax=Candidatus Roizmanbacteria bacterium CG_4_10_14_0_8_um_filter_39_9 TaxID=1974829 RepID=A0A2M7QCQ8_9BACT|nr:MAG: nucleoside-diphosphate kinase [Candidatus Roizmanbacteria bacterium CG_4_10_14_0_8_um_filter_39_9]
MNKQKALLIIKPDGVQRGLCGAILKRFEQTGLTIIGFKFLQAPEQTIRDHYPSTDVWYGKVGQRTLTNYAKKGIDVKKQFGTEDPIEIGKTVKGWLVTFFQESPVLVAAVEGHEAIEIVRKLSGNTIPILAAAGTVRGDYSHDTIDLANAQFRPLRNIIHASDSVEDGEKEVHLWFKDDEIFSYKRADEELMFPPQR